MNTYYIEIPIVEDHSKQNVGNQNGRFPVTLESVVVPQAKQVKGVVEQKHMYSLAIFWWSPENDQQAHTYVPTW